MEILKQVDLYQSKINELRPFEGELLTQIQNYYRIGLTWSSNAIEGNTLTESETKVLIEDGLTVGGKPLRYTFEAVGHANAYDYMFTLLKNNHITENDILTMHNLFYHNIENGYAGRYRDMRVIITGSKHAVTNHTKIQSEMEKLCDWIKNDRLKYHSIEFAALLHKKFVFIHPFKDGNGRVARLIMNTALIQDGYLPAIIPPVLRQEYVGLLEKAHNDDKPFIEFIAEREKESQKEMLRLLNVPIPKQGDIDETAENEDGEEYER